VSPEANDINDIEDANRKAIMKAQSRNEEIFVLQNILTEAQAMLKEYPTTVEVKK